MRKKAFNLAKKEGCCYVIRNNTLFSDLAFLSYFCILRMFYLVCKNCDRENQNTNSTNTSAYLQSVTFCLSF